MAIYGGNKMEKKIMLGNEAIARGAYEAGVKVSSAYPGTPSTEISENIVKYPEIYAEWSPNEKVAMEVAIGASMSGARALCSMKMVGVNVASVQKTLRKPQKQMTAVCRRYLLLYWIRTS